MNDAEFLASLYERCRAAYDVAASRTGTSSESFSIAGHTFVVETAGEPMRRVVTRAFRHIATEPAPAGAFIVRCLDSRTSGISVEPGDLLRLNELARTGGNLAAGQPILGGYRRPDYGLALYNRSANDAIYWISDAVDEPYSRATDFTGAGHPLKGILGWWLGDVGLSLLHAAAVGLEGAGVLLAGRSGSGKSTTAFACMDAGWQIVSEDTCVYDAATQTVHNMYCTGRLTAASRALLGTWDTPEDGWETGKSIFFLDDPPGRANLVPSLAVSAVVVPRQSPGMGTTLEQLSGGAALRALLPSTMLQSLTAHGSQAAEMADLCRRVPAFSLVIDGPPATLPFVLEGALRR